MVWLVDSMHVPTGFTLAFEFTGQFIWKTWPSILIKSSNVLWYQREIYHPAILFWQLMLLFTWKLQVEFNLRTAYIALRNYKTLQLEQNSFLFIFFAKFLWLEGFQKSNFWVHSRIGSVYYYYKCSTTKCWHAFVLQIESFTYYLPRWFSSCIINWNDKRIVLKSL